MTVLVYIWFVVGSQEIFMKEHMTMTRLYYLHLFIIANNTLYLLHNLSGKSSKSQVIISKCMT